jgi:DNA-binding CsgD family transcriptional regulator
VALVGRGPECARVENLLARARAGHSGSLLIRGEPGIGKTALLDHAASASAGLRVLRAAGVEFESELPFSTLDQLLRPLRGLIDGLPERPADALRTGLGLGPAGPTQRFDVYAATLALLAAAADEMPLLCLVDDCHWIDRASAEALAFAARRLGAEGIAMIFASRDGPADPLSAAGVPELRLSGLDPDSAAAVVARVAEVSTGALADLVAATGGNPLGLLELPGLLRPQQRAGTEPLDDPLPVSARVERVFSGQLRSLPATTRRALLLAAAAETGDAELFWRALGDADTNADALDAAHEVGLITLDQRDVVFRHPLVRSAVYSAATPAQRRAAHAALAGVSVGTQRAWHLAAAAVGPAEDVAAALESAAIDARQRGGVVAAARAFQEAARLSPGRTERAQRLRSAGDEWLRAGDVQRASDLMVEALDFAIDPHLRLAIMEALAYLAVQRGDARAACDRLLAAAEAIEGDDPRRAARAVAVAGSYPLARLDAPRMLELSERAEKLWSDGDDSASSSPVAKMLIRTHRARILAGHTEAGVHGMLHCATLCEDLPATGAAAECGESLVWVDEPTLARGLLERDVAGARDAGDHLLLAFALNPLAQLELRVGRLRAAYVAALEGADLADAIGQPLQLAYNLAVLARVEAVLGREADCRAHVARAFALVDTDVYRDAQADGRAALGTLALGLQRPEESVDELSQVRRILTEGAIAEPGYLYPWSSDLIQAYVYIGRRASAERELDTLEEAARTAGRPGPLGLCARSRGLLAPDAGCDPHFVEAIALHTRAEQPFERFRSQLAYAERLRRMRRRGEARDLLRDALAYDEAVPTPWGRRALAELSAAGARTRPPAPRAADSLTAQELRIAAAVAEGAANRDVAVRLFVSPKTVEFHLSNIYRKLGIRSRRELIRLFAHHPPSQP